MIILTVQNSPAQWLLTESALIGIIDSQDSAALQSAGVPITKQPLTQAQVDGIGKALAAPAGPTTTGSLNVSGTLSVK